MNFSDQGSTAGGVAGVWHSRRRRWLVALWLLFAATQLPQAILNYHERHPWFATVAVVATCLGVALTLIVLLERTVIDPDGVQIRRGTRGRRISWDQVQSIDDPGRWQQEQTLSVTTMAGDRLITHVPAAQHRELEAYAQAHRRRP